MFCVRCTRGGNRLLGLTRRILGSNHMSLSCSKSRRTSNNPFLLQLIRWCLEFGGEDQVTRKLARNSGRTIAFIWTLPVLANYSFDLLVVPFALSIP